MPAPQPHPFDLLVLTVANAPQRAYAQRMLELRREAGVLQHAARTLVVADPAGKRIGSGGSTLLCLAEIARMRLPAPARVLVLHSGGDARRMPAWSAAGKIWVPLQRAGRGIGPFGSPSLFDLVLAELATLPLPCGGVLVASGDAAIRLRDERPTLDAREPTVLVFPADAARASRHGVFVVERAARGAAARAGATARVAHAMQKPSRAMLRDSGALDGRGQALVDSGIFFFPHAACAAMLRGAGADPRTGRARAGSLLAAIARGAGALDLYSEIPAAMARGTTRAAFLERFAGADRGAATDTRARAAATRHRAHLARFFDAAHRVPLHAARLRAGRFLHIGTTHEWHATLASRLPERLFPELLATRGTARPPARLEAAADAAARGAHLPDFHRQIPGVVRTLLPVGARAWCAAPHGIEDDCKTTAQEGGTLCGRPLAALPARCGLDARAIWGRDPQTLWRARIFPVGDASAVWSATRWIARGTRAPAAWRRLPRRSFAQLLLQANPLRQAHADARATTAWWPPLQRTDPLGRALASARSAAATALLDRDARWRERSAHAVGAIVTDAIPPRPVVRRFAVQHDQAVWASAPVRIDLAGGWSDTPPLCFESGGCVVNAALTLGGTHPVQAMVRVEEEPAISIHSVDAGRTTHITRTAELLAYTDPTRWDALPKAALVASGLVPREPRADLRAHLRRAGGGLSLTLFSAVPRGSGLGTSSILAATLLATLDRVAGRALDRPSIAEGASLLEQMIRTGGGWQDQAGGLWGGLKQCTTAPGLRQVPRVHPLDAPPAFLRALRERSVLLYSGRRRMARGILATVVQRYLRDDPGVLRARERLVAGAHVMARAVETGDFDAFAGRLAEYRELKRSVDPASITPEIEALAAPHGADLAAWSTAGAGGGGFVLLVGRTPAAAQRILERLRRHPPHPLARPFSFDLDPSGLRLAVL